VSQAEVAGEVARVGHPHLAPHLGDAERRPRQERTRAIQPQFAKIPYRRDADLALEEMREARRREAGMSGEAFYRQVVAQARAHIHDCLHNSTIHFALAHFKRRAGARSCIVSQAFRLSVAVDVRQR
jgi:hypothetical protein